MERLDMSELIEHLTQEIARVRDLPKEEQPEAFERIRKSLDSQIADSGRPEDLND
jgi:hypothetical protein